MQPKISVIVSAYNSEKYVKETIDSILSQSLKDIEVVCVYRQSSDKTAEILKDYAKNDGRLKLYKQTETKGCGPAKNQGIKETKGEYITFMDADDFYPSTDCLEQLFNAAKKNDVKICGGLRLLKEMDGSITKHPLHRNLLKNYPNGRLLQYEDYQLDYHFHSYIYDREMVINGNFSFGTWLTYDDCHFFAPVMYFAKDFFVIPVDVYCYRCHPAYDWNYEQTLNSLIGFVDMLQFSNKHHLAILHWKTFTRMQMNEYYANFMKHIEKKELFEALLKAQSNVNDELIEYAQSHITPDVELETMDYYVDKWQPLSNGAYVLSPLVHYISEIQTNTFNELESMSSSISWKIGRIITFLPRMARKAFKYWKRYGVKKTLIKIFSKIYKREKTQQ